MEKITGQTKDNGFQFGLRKTFSQSLDNIWEFMFSKNGISIWLGELDADLELKKEFKTKNGISGLVRVFKDKSHIRLNWKKKNWANMSTLQIRIIGQKEKVTISFHQEKLLDANQRKEMKAYWNDVMNRISENVNNAFQ